MKAQKSARTGSLATHVKAARTAIQNYGILLLADATYPSLTRLIAGEPIKGSWWGHPAGKDIFNTSCELEDDPDILCLPLVAGKLSFVHRQLFPALFAVVTEEAAWQTTGLDADAKKLFASVRKLGELRAAPATRAAAKALEKRLLVLTRSVHAETGAHVKVLSSWTKVAADHGVDLATLPEPEAARARLEAVSPPGARLPWHTRKAPTSRREKG